MKVILTDNAVDFKSKLLIPKTYKQLNLLFWEQIKYLISSKKVYAYHFRYLRINGFFIPLIRYTIILLLLKVRQIPIIWSMHNFKEHKSNGYLLNKILREYLFKESKAIVVFHESIKRILPKKVKKKVYISNFGTVKNIINSKVGDEEKFRDEYNGWCGKNRVDIIVISTAKHNNYYKFITKLNKKYNILIINKYDKNFYKSKNIFKFNGVLYSSVDILIKKNERNLIGLIFHDNFSVATSYYLYSDYGIPVITNCITPNKEIIDRYKVGISIKNIQESDSAVKKIKQNYDDFNKSSKRFNEINSWQRGRMVYKKILTNLYE